MSGHFIPPESSLWKFRRNDGDRLLVAYYFARRHLGPNLRRRARMAIRRARGA